MIKKVFQKYGLRNVTKIRFLQSFLDFSSSNLGAVNDEQGERFHQNISKLDGIFLLVFTSGN
jgi:hypothetical protein